MFIIYMQCNDNSIYNIADIKNDHKNYYKNIHKFESSQMNSNKLNHR